MEQVIQDESAVERGESPILTVTSASSEDSGRGWVPVCTPSEATSGTTRQFEPRVRTTCTRFYDGRPQQPDRPSNKGSHPVDIPRARFNCFVACARSVMAIGSDPEQPERRILCHLKANSGPLGDSQTFTLENGIFRWTGKSALRVDDVLVPDPTPEDRSRLAEAIEFLHEILADGPKPSTEVEAESKARGISWATLRRAIKKVGVKPRKEDFQGRWVLEIKRCSSEGTGEGTSTFGHYEHL